MSSKISRRSILGAAGASLLSLPWLARPRSASAQSGPGRFVVFFTSNEPMNPSHWEPSGGTNLNTATLKPMMDPLLPHRSKLNIVGHVKGASSQNDPNVASHMAITHLLTNHDVMSADNQFAGHQSIDVGIAEHLSGSGARPLVAGVMTFNNRPNYRISYEGANTPIQPMTDPIAVFDKYIGPGTVDPAEANAIRNQRRSVLDVLAGQLTNLEARVPKREREKLQAHLQRVRELELRLQGQGALDCSGTGPSGAFPANNNSRCHDTIRAHIDVMAQALGCGATRVASLQIGTSGGGMTPNWGGSSGINISTDVHNICHNFNDNAGNQGVVNARVELERYWFRQFAYLLDQLDSLPEGDGTVLDHTLVLWCKPLGVKHKTDDMLFITAGGGALGVETGRYIDAKDAMHGDLLVGCGRAMGMNINTWGDPAYHSSGGAKDLLA